MDNKFYVYVIESAKIPTKTYIGYTSDLEKRLEAHNNGSNRSTKAFSPWKLKTYIAFSDKGKAEKFEVYLKTASGKAFGRKRLY